MAEELPPPSRLSELLADLVSSGRPSPELRALLGEHREAMAAWMERDDTVVSLRRRFVRSLHTQNQFLTVDAALLEGIERVLADALREAAGVLRGGRTGGERRLLALLSRHRRALRRLVAEARGDLPERVPCAQYDPALQLAALGLEGARLSEPVLDLGCGEDARLVRALRAGGIDATGLDRYVAAEGCIEGDWLGHPLGEARFGTILSHQAFSLHFIHHHVASAEMAARYAGRTLEILRALRPGGLFAYAPGLPFFEPRLERSGYRVDRIPLPAEIRRRLPPEAAYAAHVHRPGRLPFS